MSKNEEITEWHRSERLRREARASYCSDKVSFETDNPSVRTKSGEANGAGDSGIKCVGHDENLL